MAPGRKWRRNGFWTRFWAPGWASRPRCCCPRLTIASIWPGCGPRPPAGSKGDAVLSLASGPLLALACALAKPGHRDGKKIADHQLADQRRQFAPLRGWHQGGGGDDLVA